MGNTTSITKSADDKRFGDSLLAKEVKKIVLDQTSVYLGKDIKTHVAKACCLDAVKKDVALEKDNIVSIAFPVALDPKSDRCAKDGVCLDTDYIGLQIDDDRVKWCGDDKSGGNAGYHFPNTSVGGTNPVCDNFMMDSCAKSLYEQGCIKMGKNKAGALVPQYANSVDNKMCWNDTGKKMRNPPECYCLNSMFGPNLNTWPAKIIAGNSFGTANPYGLTGDNIDEFNRFSKYSLNIFKADSTKQYPYSLDKTCISTVDKPGSGVSIAYRLAKDTGKTVTVCLNQINIADSNIGTANMSDINQSNNCGGAPADTQAPTTDSVPVNPDQKIDPAVKAAADKKIIDDAVAKKKAEDEAKATADALVAAKAKALADEKAAIVKQQEAAALISKTKTDADTSTAKTKADADLAIAKVKTDADIATAKAKADADAAIIKAKADTVATKLQADAAIAKAQADADTAAAEKNKNNMYIGGGILLVIIIGLIIFMMSGKSKPSRSNDDE